MSGNKKQHIDSIEEFNTKSRSINDQILAINDVIVHNKDKFVDLLKKEGVRFDRKGRIRLDDLVSKIITSKKPDLYIERIKCKILVKELYFISVDDAYLIVCKGNSKVCRRIRNILESAEVVGGSVIDISRNLFQYDGRKFIAFFVDDGKNKFGLWVQGSQICKYLGYNDEAQALVTHVNQQNKIQFGNLFKSLSSDHKKPMIPSNANFINYDGLLQLVSKSKMPASIDFALFLNIPVMRKNTFHETEIMKSLFDFFYASNINYIYQYPAKKYRIDCYLTDHNISIEIDERGHRDRDQNYEKKRESDIIQYLNCTFLRCNPDDPNFSIFSFIGNIVRIINNN